MTRINTALSIVLCVHALACSTRIPPEERQLPPRARDVVTPAVPDAAELVPLEDVHLEGFLGQRVAANVEQRLLRIPNDLLLDGFAERPLIYWAGERTGKWIDAAALAWRHSGDPELRRKLDEVVTGLMASQMDDGYLGTNLEQDRWDEWDVWIQKYVLLGLLRDHEMTGNEAALETARRAADLLLETFAPGKRRIIDAGAHMGMAATSVLEPMVLLYRRTGERRYLDFAHQLVSSWEQEGGPHIIDSLLTTHSVRRTANAKAYEMISNLVGLLELYRTTGEPRLLEPVLIAWEDIRKNQLYVTGGASVGEHFTEPHALPNEVGERIHENCVTVSWIQLSAQLYRLTGQSRYIDEVETALYNGLLGAQRGDGGGWCYYTPLTGTKPFTEAVHCCSSNGPRALALAPSLAFAHSEGGLAVNLWEAGRARLLTPGGQPVELTLSGGAFPAGAASIRLALERPETFVLALRVPSWTQEMSVEIAGEPLATLPEPGTFYRLSREWSNGDVVDVHLDLAPRLLRGEGTDAGRVAALVGPLVLAVDGRDNPQALPPTAAGLLTAADEWNPHIRVLSEGETEWPGQVRVEAAGFLTRHGEDPEPLSLELRDFATAGAEGAPFAVWLLASEGATSPTASLFFAAAGSSSSGSPEADAYLTICPYCPVRLLARILNRGARLSTVGETSSLDRAQSALTDGDAKSLCVAFADRADGTAWFEVKREEPIETGVIEVIHGITNLDGGWFDTRQGRPEVWLREGDGGWQKAGELLTYPATSDVDPGPLRGGEAFELRLEPPRRLTGIRIVGAPSGGKGEDSAAVDLDGQPVDPTWRGREPFVTLGELRALPPAG